MSGNISLQSSPIDNSQISSSFNKSEMDYTEHNDKRFHITIINHNCQDISNVYKIKSKSHKEFLIYRESLNANADSVTKDRKQLQHKIFQVKRKSIKNDQEDLIIFD